MNVVPIAISEATGRDINRVSNDMFAVGAAFGAPGAIAARTFSLNSLRYASKLDDVKIPSRPIIQRVNGGANEDVPIFVVDRPAPIVPANGSNNILALPAPGHRANTLSEVRNLQGRQKWEAGETYIQELYGSAGQRHYPVPGTGGRFVDSPVDLPNGGVLAHEVKTYNFNVRAGGLNEVPLSDKIYQQVEKDMYFRDNMRGYEPRWHFLETPPSKDLSRILELNNIMHIIYK